MMKYLLIILVALSVNDPIKVAKINKLKTEAKAAFQSGDYKTAAEKYAVLSDSLGVKEDEVLLNLAHSKYLLKDTANAFSTYQNLTGSTKKEIASKANQQLGILSNQQNKPELALNYFKEAIKANPQNEEARYDYEMLKKKLDEQKKKQQQQQQNQDKQKKDQQNQDQQNKDQQNKEDQEKKDQENKDQQKKDDQKKGDQQKKDEQNKDQQKKEQEQKDKEQQEQEQKQKEQQEKDQKKDKDMKNFDQEKMPKMSPEKARMILEAMKNQEKQYLQQNKRKATKSKDRNKPDW